MAVCLLLGIGIAVQWLCCLGVLLGRNPYARLHFVGAATLLGAPLFAAAVVIQEPLAKGGIKAILIGLALLVTGPIVSHATARAARNRRGSPVSGP